MAKHINAELLRAEIKKRLKNVRDYMTGAGMKYKGPKYFKAQGKESAYDALLNVITSLQQEQKEVDLEKELADYCRRYYNYDYPKQAEEGTGSSVMPHIIEAAKYFYELGRLKTKEEDK